MKQLDNGMKPSEYLNTHEGRVKLKLHIRGMLSSCYQYPKLHSCVCLLKNGNIIELIKEHGLDWEYSQNIICVLCEFFYPKDLLIEYISQNLNTPEKLFEFLKQWADDDDLQVLETQNKQSKMDRWEIYEWFEKNTHSIKLARGNFISQRANIDYDKYIDEIIEKLKAEGN